MSSQEKSGERRKAPPKNGPREAPTRATVPRPARAELIWDGKYDAAGRRVAPLRVALPFQTVETVNESTQDRQKGFQFGSGFREEAWRNRLILGDKKYVLGQPERHVPQRVADLSHPQAKSLQLEITHAYADPGDYTIVVKVIDILGNDTTKTVKVTVG